MPESAELTALDLSVVDVSIPALTLGAWTNFYSPANGIQGSYLLYKRTLHMTAPANDTVSFGPVQQTITGTSLADKAEAKADNDALKEETQEMINSAMEGQDGKFSEINQSIDQIELRVGNAEGNISSLTLQADRIVSQVEDAEDNISRVEQTADKINWVVQSGTSASNFTLTSHMAELVSDEVHIVTDDLQISSISYGGSCHVQCSSSGVDIYPGWGDVTIGNPSGTIDLMGRSVYAPTLRPEGSPNCIVGNGNCVIYGQVSGNSWAENSDRELKYDITDIEADAAGKFIAALKPSSYHMVEPLPEAVKEFNIVQTRDAQEPGDTRYGFIAQDVQAAMKGAGMTDGIVVTMDGGTLGLRYTELIAPLVKVVQDLAARVEALEGSKDNG